MLRRIVACFHVFLAALLVASAAAATLPRTFVSATGLDTNPCNLPSPCRTFGTAITNTNNGGEIVTLDSGGYGAVVITKPVSIIVPSGIYAGVAVNGAAVDGIVVDIPGGGGTVFLRGLQITGQGGTNGVRIHQANKVILEDITISGFFNGGNGRAILDNSTSSFTELVLRNVVIRDGDAGIVVDGTTGNKSVSIENSLINGFFNTTCISLTDNVHMLVSNSTITSCNTGFVATQPASSTGYLQLQMERTTMTSIGPGPAVKLVNNATDRAPNFVLSDSHMFNTSGVTVTNGGNVAIDRSTFDGCGGGPNSACIDVGGTNGFSNIEVTKSEIRHAAGGIRLALGGTMGGNLSLVDSRISGIYPNEAIYLGGTTCCAAMVAKGNSINGNKKGVFIDSNANAKLTTNQIVFNAGGGLVKVPAGTNQYIESSNDNYVRDNGSDPGAPPDAIPATITLR
jgi:hypothetical protein